MAKRKHVWQKSLFTAYDYVCLNCPLKANVSDGQAKFEHTPCIPPKTLEYGRGVSGLKWKDDATKKQAESLVHSITKESENE